MRFVTCTVCEHQLRLLGHAAGISDADSAHQILSVSDRREWRRPMGGPCASLFQQVDWHLKEMGMGQESAWGCPDGGSWSAGGKWPQRRTAPAHLT